MRAARCEAKPTKLRAASEGGTCCIGGVSSPAQAGGAGHSQPNRPRAARSEPVFTQSASDGRREPVGLKERAPSAWIQHCWEVTLSQSLKPPLFHFDMYQSKVEKHLPALHSTSDLRGSLSDSCLRPPRHHGSPGFALPFKY